MSTRNMMRDSGFLIPVEADLPRLMALINAAYGPVESPFYDGPRTTPEEMRDKFRNGTFLVDQGADGAPRGLVHVIVDGPLGYFGPVAVDPRHQGTGLGRRLVEAAEQHCRDAGCRAIEVDVVNHRQVLLDFYARRGYVAIGRRPFPDDPPPRLPTHFVVMLKTLSAE